MGFAAVLVSNSATNTVTSTILVGNQPIGIAASGTRAYVANSSGNNVSVIDTSTNTVAATVAVGTNPQ